MRLDRLLCFFFVNSQELVLGYDVNFDAAFLVGLLDRLHHHRIRANLAYNQCTHPLLDQAQRGAPAGLAHGGPRKGHNIVDGFGGSQIRGKPGAGYLVFSAPATTDARPKQITAIIKAIVFTTAPPSSLYVDSLKYFFIFFCSNLSILFNFLASLRNLET